MVPLSAPSRNYTKIAWRLRCSHMTWHTLSKKKNHFGFVRCESKSGYDTEAPDTIQYSNDSNYEYYDTKDTDKEDTTNWRSSGKRADLFN